MNSQQQIFPEQASETENYIDIQKMTAEEIKNGGSNLSITYSFAESPFGKILMASTSKGICHTVFYENKLEAIAGLKSRFPNAGYSEGRLPEHEQALKHFHLEPKLTEKVQLQISGTPFQFEVWEALLTIPVGQLSTYGALASQIGKPKASRAVGSAIGKNPVAFLIPCHRVVQATGQIGGYMWGADRKYAIIAEEAAHTNGA